MLHSAYPKKRGVGHVNHILIWHADLNDTEDKTAPSSEEDTKGDDFDAPDKYHSPYNAELEKILNGEDSDDDMEYIPFDETDLLADSDESDIGRDGPDTRWYEVPSS